MRTRREKGQGAYALGIDAEATVCAALEQDGWTILGRRLRTKAGEVDAVAEKDGLLAIIEVKARPRHHAQAAGAIEAFKKIPPPAWPRSRRKRASHPAT